MAGRNWLATPYEQMYADIQGGPVSRPQPRQYDPRRWDRGAVQRIPLPGAWGQPRHRRYCQVSVPSRYETSLVDLGDQVCPRRTRSCTAQSRSHPRPPLWSFFLCPPRAALSAVDRGWS